MPKISTNTKCLKDADFEMKVRVWYSAWSTSVMFGYFLNIFECVHDAMIFAVESFI